MNKYDELRGGGSSCSRRNNGGGSGRGDPSYRSREDRKNSYYANGSCRRSGCGSNSSSNKFLS